jgi:DivIVA domain-containing protein
MEWAIAVSVIVVLGAAAAIAAGGLGEMSREPVRDSYRQDLPEHALTPEDVQALRFGVQFRGYAMDQVDDVLARLSHEIADRDALIADLTREPSTDRLGTDRPGTDRPGTDRPGTDRPETVGGDDAAGTAALAERGPLAQDPVTR